MTADKLQYKYAHAAARVHTHPPTRTHTHKRQEAYCFKLVYDEVVDPLVASVELHLLHRVLVCFPNRLIFYMNKHRRVSFMDCMQGKATI